jgi:hypothetical protein
MSFQPVVNFVLYCFTGALYLAINELDGTLPTEIGELTKLSEYYRDWCNDVHIVILITLYSTAGAGTLNLFNNSFTGAIPSVIGLLTNLGTCRRRLDCR